MQRLYSINIAWSGEIAHVRHTFCNAGLTLFLGVVGLCRTLPEFDGGTTMTVIYLFSALLALGLLVYLFVALLKPEWF
jgi:K+-transporting ATPase KdpF subunit